MDWASWNNQKLVQIFKEEFNCSYKIRLLNLHVKRYLKFHPKTTILNVFNGLKQPSEKIAKMEMQTIKKRKRDLIS